MAEFTTSPEYGGKIPWDDLTVDVLYDIFEQAGLQPEIDADGDLIVYAHISGTLYVGLEDADEAIDFFKFAHLRDDVDRDEVLAKIKTVLELDEHGPHLQCVPVSQTDILSSYTVGMPDGWTPGDIVNTFHEVDRAIGIFREQVAPFATEHTLDRGFDRVFNNWNEAVGETQANSLTTGTLFEVFRGANMEPEHGGDGLDTLVVQGHSGIRYAVCIPEGTGIMQFFTHWPFPDDLDTPGRTALLSRLNMTVAMVRFHAADGDETFVASYGIPTNLTLTPEQIVTLFNRVDQIVDNITDDLEEMPDEHE